MIKKCDTFNSCSIVLTCLCSRNWAACVTLANCSITTGLKMLKSVVVNHIGKHIDLECFRVLLSSDSHSSWEHQPWYNFPTAYSTNLFDLLMLSAISYQRNELMSMCVCGYDELHLVPIKYTVLKSPYSGSCGPRNLVTFTFWPHDPHTRGAHQEPRSSLQLQCQRGSDYHR